MHFSQMKHNGTLHVNDAASMAKHSEKHTIEFVDYYSTNSITSAITAIRSVSLIVKKIGK